MDMEFLKIFGLWTGCVLGLMLIIALYWTIFDKGMRKNMASVKLTNDFDLIYKELSIECKKKLERKKKKELYITILFLIYIILSVPLMCYVGEYTKIDIDVYSKISSMIFIVGIITLFVYENSFNLLYKKEIVERLAKMVNPSFEYRRKEGGALRKIYEEVGFSDKPFTHSYVDDYIIGNLDKSAVVSLGDLTLENAVKSADKKIYIPVFKGIVAFMNYNNDIRNNIVIEDNRIVDIGSELPEFFLNRLIEIYKKYGIVPEIRIKRGYVFLRIHTGEFFEPGVDPMDKQKLFNYYNVIKFVNEVMTEIKNATEV